MVKNLGSPGSSAGRESTCNAGDPGSIPGSGGSAGEGIGYPLQYSWTSLVTQLVKNLPAMRETWSWVGKIPWRRERLPTPVFWPGEFHGLYKTSSCKESDTTEKLHFLSFMKLSIKKWTTQSKNGWKTYIDISPKKTYTFVGKVISLLFLICCLGWSQLFFQGASVF